MFKEKEPRTTTGAGVTYEQNLPRSGGRLEAEEALILPINIVADNTLPPASTKQEWTKADAQYGDVKTNWKGVIVVFEYKTKNVEMYFKSTLH